MIPNPCPVCGCDELQIDEVLDRHPMLLVECPRCELRRVVRLVPVLRAPLRADWEAPDDVAAA